MTFGSRKTTFAAAALIACLLGVAIVKAQAPTEKPPISDQVFKNVQVMKGIPVDQFMATMGFFSASLGMSCEDCHMADDRNWNGFAADNTRKRMARRMIQMMQKINEDNFGGRQMVTCWSCHRGADAPRTVPDFNVQDGPLPPPDPNAVIAQNPLAPMPDDVFNKYIQAVGGAQRAAAVTGFTATGTNVGYGPESADKRQTEIYVEGQPAAAHASSFTRATATTRRPSTAPTPGMRHRCGRSMCCRSRDRSSKGAKIDAMLHFPAQIKQIAPRWRVGVSTTIDDKDVDVVQGNTAGGVDRDALLRSEDGSADAVGAVTRIRRSARFPCRPTTRIIATSPASRCRSSSR